MRHEDGHCLSHSRHSNGVFLAFERGKQGNRRIWSFGHWCRMRSRSLGNVGCLSQSTDTCYRWFGNRSSLEFDMSFVKKGICAGSYSRRK